MKAILKNYRQSPRKVALAAGLIRGKNVAEALIRLRFAGKRAGGPMITLIESAMANAKNSGISNPEFLIVKEVRVDKGITLKRIMPRAQGNAARINKRSSHIILVLGEDKKGEAKAAKKAARAERAKTTPTKKVKAAKVSKPVTDSTESK